MMRIATCGLLIWSCLPAVALAGEFEGRYERAVTVQNLEDGADVELTNFVEIEHREPSALFFVYESWHTNGHACRLWGVAQERESGVYEFIEDSNPTPDANTCKALVYATDEHLVIEDVGGYCRTDHCGARGEIGKDHFPIESRTALRDVVRVPW